VTSGEASEGAWTSLGAIADKCWWWQLGMGVNDATMINIGYFADLGIGDGSNKFPVIENMVWAADNSEKLANTPVVIGCEFEVPASGQTAYGRLQCGGVPDSNLSLIAYGVV